MRPGDGESRQGGRKVTVKEHSAAVPEQERGRVPVNQQEAPTCDGGKVERVHG